MPLAKPITIVGGGLAGLTLGIGLRQRGVPVTIHEAGNYPRHRVCGEFVSGQGLEILAAFGLKEEFLKAGAIETHSAVFFFGNSRSPIRALPKTALCLSRFVMDKLLADIFLRRGGELRTGTRWSDDFSGGVVRANGRRILTTENGWRWFGLKAHARNVTPAAGLEMHLGKKSYVGICQLNGGLVNVCGLFRRGHSDAPSPGGFDLLRGTPGTTLNERLAQAEFDETSFCSVAGLSLQPQRAADISECRIGDALTMIPPVTGNGMSLAFESAQLAVEPLVAFSRGDLPWAQAQQSIARACDELFHRRLSWANWLQRLMFLPILQMRAGSFVFHSEAVWKMMFARTR